MLGVVVGSLPVLVMNDLHGACGLRVPRITVRGLTQLQTQLMARPPCTALPLKALLARSHSKHHKPVSFDPFWKGVNNLQPAFQSELRYKWQFALPTTAAHAHGLDKGLSTRHCFLYYLLS